MEKESDHKEDLEASIAQLDVKVEQFAKDVAEATAQIAEPQLNLQRASEDRKAENADYKCFYHERIGLKCRMQEVALQEFAGKLSG